jgi:uncharacterized protein (TIGR02117 family)
MPIKPIEIQAGFFIRILCATVVFLTTACTTTDEWRYPPRTADDAVRIYVVKHGWHTGVVVPNLGKRAPFSFLDPEFGEAAFYEFGRGDRAYYPAQDPGVRLALQAVLWPTPSVLHVVALSKPPPVSFAGAEMEELSVSMEGYRHLLNYLTQYFVLNERSQPIAAGRGLYGHSRFFESHGSFHAFNTCNTWTVRALQHGGAPVRSFMTLTADVVLRQAREAREELMQERKENAVRLRENDEQAAGAAIQFARHEGLERLTK